MKRSINFFLVMLMAVLLCSMLSVTVFAADNVPKGDPTGTTIGF